MTSYSITSIFMLHLCQWFGKEVLAQFPSYGHMRDDYGNSFGPWMHHGFNDDNNYLHEFFEMNRQNMQHQKGPNYHPPYLEGNQYQHESHGYDEEFNPEEYHKVGPNHGDYHHPIRAAVVSHHQRKVYHVPERSHYNPTVVNFEGKVYPVVLHFNSYSSPLIANQQHHDSMYHNYPSFPQNEPSHQTHNMNQDAFHPMSSMITPYSGMYHLIGPMQSKNRARWANPPASYL